MVRRISVEEVRSLFPDAHHALSEEIIVERDGEPVAALISLEQYHALATYRGDEEDLEWEILTEVKRVRREHYANTPETEAKQAERDWELILEARNAHLDPDEVYREVTAVVEAVRQENYDRERERNAAGAAEDRL